MPVSKTVAQFYFSLRHACVYQSDSKRAGCHEICYLRFLLNSVPILSFSLKLDKRATYFFYVHVTVHRNKFLFNKTNRRINFQIYFIQGTLLVSDGCSAHHQEFSTVPSALVYLMQV